MPFKEGHKKVGGRVKKITDEDKKADVTSTGKEFMIEIANSPILRKKYLKEMKSPKLRGKSYVDAYHASLDYSIGKMNKIDPNTKKLPPITINLIQAQPDRKNLEETNTIDITHEETDSDS